MHLFHLRIVLAQLWIFECSTHFLVLLLLCLFVVYLIFRMCLYFEFSFRIIAWWWIVEDKLESRYRIWYRVRQSVGGGGGEEGEKENIKGPQTLIITTTTNRSKHQKRIWINMICMQHACESNYSDGDIYNIHHTRQYALSQPAKHT